MKKTLSNLAALGLGAACAAWLIWLWVHDRAEVPPLAHERPVAAATAELPAPPVAAPDVPAGLDPATKTLLAALEQILARHDARAHEAVLGFANEEAYHRFLARAQKASLEVIGQIDALHSVRVRYGKFSALQGDLLQNVSDYSDVAANTLIGIPQPPPREARTAANLVAFGNRTLDFLGATGDRSTWGRGTTIAVLDTGISADPTFGTGRVSTLDIGLGAAPGNGAEDGHATAVAALAAGGNRDAAGVAPAANLLSIRVTDANGASDIFTVSQAILAATDAGAKIINISLGGYATSAALDAAIGYATDHGAVIVAAAGNDQAAQLSWPAADTRVISVGAVDAAGQQVTFSNSGPQLQLTAPGYGVQTAWLGAQRALVDGTSVSSPLVAGAIAAVMSQNPNLTPLQAAQVLIQTASDAGAPGDDANFGNGILNLGSAMNRNDPSYADTAVASHYYDVANQQMQFVVQNRGSQAVAGMTLDVTAGGITSTHSIPTLGPGETFIVTEPVDPAALQASGKLTFATTLNNPLGLADRVPSNNRRSSVLTAPTK